MLSPVVPSEHFENDIKELKQHYKRIDDVRIALMWELTRNPRAGEELLHRPGFWVFLTYPIGSMPTFRVLYKFSRDHPDTVLLLRIASANTDKY